MQENVTILPGGMEPLWGLKELKKYLGCSEEKARRLIKQYHLPYNQWGKRTSALRFRPEEVRQWVIANELMDVGEPQTAAR